MRRILLIFFLASIAGELKAQFFNDNLYGRYQLNELMKLRYKNRGVPRNLPTKCEPTPTAKDLWNKAELQLTRATVDRRDLIPKEIEMYKACIEADSSFCDAYFRLAQCLVERTDWVAVIKVLRASAKKFPDDPMVYMGLGQAFLYLQYPEEGLKNFDKLIEILPNSAEGYLGASWASHEMGQPKKALDYLHQGLDKLGGDTQYLKVFESILLYDANQTRKAFDILSELEAPLGARPGGFVNELEGIGEYYLGLCYVARGEGFYHKALHHIRLAKKEGIQVDTTLARTIGLLVRVDNIVEQLLSTYHVENVICNKSDSQADDAFENRRIDEALTFYSQLVKKDSASLYPYVRLAECFQQKRDFRRALEMNRLAYRKFPEDEQVRTRMIRQMVRADSLRAALDLTMNLISRNPKHAEAFFQGALILALMDRQTDAIALMKKLELKYAGQEGNMPWRISFLLGELYYLSGQSTVALSYFRFAIKYGSQDPYLNYYYARCLGDSGNLVEAKRYFYAAVEHGAIIDKSSIKKFQLIEKQSTPYGEKY